MLAWFEQHGRKDLPWQQEPTPYRVWVSEIMLQQTQVQTVIPYYLRFMQRFPDVATLAAAPVDRVLELWTGLGYYARARNLHKAAQHIIEHYEGALPCDQALLEALPGIGRSTAGAILALGCGCYGVILDGNVKRVLARYHAIDGWPGQSKVAAKLWQLVNEHTPQDHVGDYTQAMMDLGATVCTRSNPACQRCPLQNECEASKQGAPTAWPHPKPRKERPSRSAKLLLVRKAGGELLVVKRPPSGLWGGLWSLPELPSGEDLASWLGKIYGLKVSTHSCLASFLHQFTHFTLSITPILVDVTEDGGKLQEMAPEALLWYNTAHPAPGGFPAPVVKLMQLYCGENDTSGAER